MAKKLLRTRLCDLLGIEYPIVLAGMGTSSGPSLAAAVSNAGGLGILGVTRLSPDEIHGFIRRTRELTDRPFGADLLVPAGLPEDGSGGGLPADKVAFVEDLRKKIGVPPATRLKRELPSSTEWVKQQIYAVLDEKVPVLAAGLGSPDWLIPEAHARGIKIVSLVGNVKTAKRLAERGVDIIVAQGHEAGGHTGRIGTMVLVPQVVDAVAPMPVLAAGGIGDGRGLAAALALGADGVWVGTAFTATHEASREFVETGAISQSSVDNWKKRIVEATEEDTQITRIYTGKTMRAIKNKLIETWDKSGVSTLPMPYQQMLVGPLEAAIMESGKGEYMSGPGGQIVGMIKEIKPAGQVVADMVAGAIEVLKRRLPRDVEARG